MPIDTELFTTEALVSQLVDIKAHPWREHVIIIPDYMPRYPSGDTKPECQVRFSSTEHEGAPGEWFLRYSRGPLQGHFWDCYGEDYHNPALALIALLQAPPPPGVLRAAYALASTRERIVERIAHYEKIIEGRRQDGMRIDAESRLGELRGILEGTN